MGWATFFCGSGVTCPVSSGSNSKSSDGVPGSRRLSGVTAGACGGRGGSGALCGGSTRAGPRSGVLETEGFSGGRGDDGAAGSGDVCRSVMLTSPSRTSTIAPHPGQNFVIIAISMANVISSPHLHFTVSTSSLPVRRDWSNTGYSHRRRMSIASKTNRPLLTVSIDGSRSLY